MRTVREPDTATLDRMVRRIRDWNLVADGCPVCTAYSTLQFAARGSEKLILKCAPLDNDEVQGLTALAFYDGIGAVRVHAIEDGCALLERAMPATPLADLVRAGKDDEATAIWCDVAESLAGSSLGGDPADRNWPTVEDWGRSFDDYRQGPRHLALPDALLDEAERLYRDLAASQGPRMFLHADLHHDNILFDQARGWIAIDPKGLAGEFAYEVWALLHNPLGEEGLYTDPAILDRRVNIVCDRLGFEPPRVLHWCVAQSVLSALQHIEDGDDERCIRANVAVAMAAKRLIAKQGANC